jgi:hypothetical protein
MRTRAWVIGLVGIVSACDKPSSTPAPADSASASEPGPTEAPPQPPRAAPPDVNVGKLRNLLKCPAAKGTGACGVLEEFNQASRWILDVPSGEGRWFGKAFVVEKGDEKFQYVTLLAKRLPTAKVGPGELPLSLGMDPIPERLLPFAEELWSGLDRSNGRRAKRKNPAFGYLAEYEPRAARGAMNTTGTSVQSIGEIGEDTSYLRQAGLKKIFLVRPATGAQADTGDGTYAVLWMAVW